MKTFPNLQVKDISEFINAELSLTAANGETILSKGWVQIDFQICPVQDILHVSFLVTEKALIYHLWVLTFQSQLIR